MKTNISIDSKKYNIKASQELKGNPNILYKTSQIFNLFIFFRRLILDYICSQLSFQLKLSDIKVLLK